MTLAVKRRTRSQQCITTSQAVKCEQQLEATSTRWPLVKLTQIKPAALILFQ